ncbi:hypothetical protein HZR84_10335 [Hyphobacterium sp. CCMP332]|nr:hypothetical protein HZR84_10335 [Hyphobacterium sp. CCMP332]
MRFPSFIRLPRHQKFHYEPRFYDPVKEDLDRRISLAKKQIPDDSNDSTRERISAQWKRTERNSQKASFRQLIILIILISSVVLYFYFGNNGIYGIIGTLIVGYLIFKYKQFNKAK